MVCRRIFVFLALALCFLLTSCGDSKGNQAKAIESMASNDPLVAESREAREKLHKSIEEAKQYLSDEAVSRLEADDLDEGTSDGTDAIYDEEPISVSEERLDDGDENIGITTSREDLQQILKDNEDLTFYKNVPNDTTNRWRMGVYYSGTSQENMALDYYNAFFEDDNETHALINLANKTSACLNVFGDKIDIMIYEYVDKEETDADKMFTGMFYTEYQVDKNTGEIEKVQ